jgi:hypothetical protein
MSAHTVKMRETLSAIRMVSLLVPRNQMRERGTEPRYFAGLSENHVGDLNPGVIFPSPGDTHP